MESGRVSSSATIAAVAIAALVILSIGVWLHAQNNRYTVLMQNDRPIWVLDTRSGAVKACYNSGPATPPVCTPFSN